LNYWRLEGSSISLNNPNLGKPEIALPQPLSRCRQLQDYHGINLSFIYRNFPMDAFGRNLNEKRNNLKKRHCTFPCRKKPFSELTTPKALKSR